VSGLWCALASVVRAGLLGSPAESARQAPKGISDRREGDVAGNVHRVERRQPGGDSALRLHEGDWFHSFPNFHDSRCPGETGSKSNESQMVADFRSALLQGFTKRDGDRGGGSVAIPVDVHEYLLVRDADIPGRALDDACIGLVRDEEIDVIRG